MATKRKTAAQRKHGLALEARRLRVYRGWCQGKNQLQLASEEGVVHSQISRDLATSFQSLATQTSDKERAAATVELLGKLAYAESELLAAWERSKKPRNRSKAKTVEADGKTKDGKPKGGRREAEKVTEGRDGNPRYWERLQSLWEFKAKLLGILVQKVAPTTPDGQEPYPLIPLERVVAARARVQEYRNARLGPDPSTN